MEHMDTYWEAVSILCGIVNMLGTGYILYRFAKPFMENKRWAFCIGIVYFIAMVIQDFAPVMINTFLAYSIGVFAAFVVMCRIDRRNYRQKIFITATFFSLRHLSVCMARIITELFYRFDKAKTPVMGLVLFGIIELTDCIMGFALLGISVRCIVKTCVYKRDDMSVKEMLMLTVPSIMGMTGYGIMIQYQTSSGMSWMEPVSGLYNGLAFLYFGIAIITIVVVTVLFQKIKAGQEEKLQNELLATQIDSLERHIGQVESLYENIRSIRHDMTNHILTLERLYVGNNAKEAANYSRELKSALSSAAGGIKSGNPVTDVILQAAKDEAVKRKICFRSDFYYPTGTNINAFDVSVILNNALQNAMEHLTCFPSENEGRTEPPYISVLSYHSNNAYMIEISNSFTGNLQWDEDRELPVTSKEKMEGHGYGLSNIRMVARKYSGDIAIDLKKNEFRLSVMLMMQ